MNPEIISERESRFEQEVAADNVGPDGVENFSAVNGNKVDLAVEPGKPRFKAIDVGVIQYLKLVHTELYEKLKAAVHSIKSKNN